TRSPAAPRSLTVRMPILIPPLTAHRSPLTAYRLPLTAHRLRSPRHERHPDRLRGRPRATHVDLQARPWPRLVRGQIRGADGAIDGGRHGAASHDVQPAVIEVHRVTGAGHDARLEDLEPHEAALHA